jgi:DNA (cytosine-5)-methyltransferase 3A
MRVLSLFDGISCGAVALKKQGFEIDKYVAWEIDNDAIQISKKNHFEIEHNGDVFEADFSQYKNYDLVMGGSPCTFWSVARMNTKGEGTPERETEAEGLGYDMFMKFVEAVRVVNPKYFLYENNFSINKKIKDAITNELGVEPIVINSKLVSAQSRKRCYWTNIPGVKQPKDKGVVFNQVITSDRDWRVIGEWAYKHWGDKKKIDGLKSINCEKSHTLTTSKTHPMNYYLNHDKTMYSNLTAEEFETLQTLPIGYTEGITNGKRYKAIGNGWTVDVIAHILSFIKA